MGLACSKCTDYRMSVQNAWTPTEKQIEEQDRPRHVSVGHVLYSKLAINEKKMVSRKLLVLQLLHSITALIFIMCLLLWRKKQKRGNRVKPATWEKGWWTRCMHYWGIFHILLTLSCSILTRCRDVENLPKVIQLVIARWDPNSYILIPLPLLFSAILGFLSTS